MERDDDSKASEPNSESRAEARRTDIVLIHGRTEDGKGLSVIRHRDNQLEHGLVLPLEHGKPIQGEVVRLKPRPEFPVLCDVHVEYSPTVPHAQLPNDTRAVAKGPGQVATDQYRSNWDKIFDRRSTSDGELN